MKPMEYLQQLMDEGSLHHVTYRCQGTVWEGLWFYKKDSEGFRGYSVAGCINKNSPDYENSYNLTNGIGLHVGSYGNG